MKAVALPDLEHLVGDERARERFLELWGKQSYGLPDLFVGELHHSSALAKFSLAFKVPLSSRRRRSAACSSAKILAASMTEAPGERLFAFTCARFNCASYSARRFPMSGDGPLSLMGIGFTSLVGTGSLVEMAEATGTGFSIPSRMLLRSSGVSLTVLGAAGF